LRKGRIIEADHRQRARQFDPAAMRYGQHTGRHVIVAGENGGGRSGGIKEDHGRRLAAREIERPFCDQHRIVGNPGAVQRAAIASQPVLRCKVIG
jgi:hypothetical protein